MAKLAAGAGEYDLVVIVSSLAERAIQAGFVEPLDLSLVPNFNSLFPRMQTLEFIRHEGAVYGAPTFWSISPITVNSEAIPEGDDFALLFDPQYAGRLAMWDDVSTLGDVANWMGIDDIWNMTDAELDEVKARLIAQKPLIRTYWSQAGEAIDLFMNREIVATNSWSYITTALAAQGLPVREFVSSPPIGAIDSHFVVSGSRNRDLAHRFINHILRDEAQGSIGELTGYTPTNPGSKAYMPAEVWEALRIDQFAETLDTMKFWEDIPRRSRYLQVFAEVKAA
jgi:putative spermidine/putrescine transport system substrate-binding protein/spermidine/putrescine transport system substrate-binding protein